MNNFVEGIALKVAQFTRIKTDNPKRLGLIILLVGFVGLQILLVMSLL